MYLFHNVNGGKMAKDRQNWERLWGWHKRTCSTMEARRPRAVRTEKDLRVRVSQGDTNVPVPQCQWRQDGQGQTELRKTLRVITKSKPGWHKHTCSTMEARWPRADRTEKDSKSKSKSKPGWHKRTCSTMEARRPRASPHSSSRVITALPSLTTTRFTLVKSLRISGSGGCLALSEKNRWLTIPHAQLLAACGSGEGWGRKSTMEQMAGVGVEVKLLASRLVRNVLSVFVLNMMLGLWMETVSFYYQLQESFLVSDIHTI